MELQEHIPLAPYTTFNIGGVARYFAVAKTVDDIKQSLDFARDKNITTFVLGGGSNVLIADEGFEGLALHIALKGDFKVSQQEDGSVHISAQAGESWDVLVAYTVDEQLWGLENLSGIPGTVGGAVVQNIGAYGAALSQVLQSVEVFDTKTGHTERLSLVQCEFAYRESIFKREEGRYVVLSATVVLSRTPHPNLSYKDLTLRFADRTPILAEIRESVLEIRKAKFPDVSVEGTAGSFFKNPVLPKAEAEELKAKYPELPLFTLAESSDIKVPLGWFLDYRHGVFDMRDVRVGGARMYEKQFLVLVAARGTTAKDVRALASLVQEKIFEKLKIKIEPEVKII